ncbi:putative late blight resistance protein-like protein R1B-16 [Forsythia ovata]|uniref:Late blight resistance protein-like protein R1B-16 n=1 Tax=Forsythia ovata TaxID=205694 RepID=A0ABD1TSG1_9LAMI
MAYAVLLSLTNYLEHVLHQHLVPQNEKQIETLLERVNFLKDFLENSSPQSSKVTEGLEIKIIDATYKAEYIVESQIAASHGAENFSNLEKVIVEIDSIKQEAMEVKDEIGSQDLLPRISLSSSSKPASIGKGYVVGIDDDLEKIKEQLIQGSSNLETVSIVGMGGIGKTTLAKEVYGDKSISYYFDIRTWVTVSQDYNVQEILQGLRDSMQKLAKEKKGDEKSSASTPLDEVLYKNLKGMRYLVIMDDVWDTKVWDDVNRLFPNDNNGSRIMLTTRQEQVAVYANSRLPLHHIPFMNDDNSWKLLCKEVFEKVSCPPELEKIGKEIAKNCRGLPLAVVLIGGLLSKATKTQHYWRDVAANLISAMTSNDDQFLKILSLSYNHLPHHLKGCFLYMGIFPEDYNIRVAMLVKLWVAEGILQPVKSKSLEDVAYEYLLDLVDRNLVFAFERSYDGKIKVCKIHDLLRDLCTREAQRKNFFHVTDENLLSIPRDVNVHRVSIHSNREILYYRCINLPTSLIQSSLFVDGRLNLQVFANLRLLRVLHAGCIYNLPDRITQLVNLRYLSGRCEQAPLESIYKLRNLQTLIMHEASVQLPQEIWKMTQLRHIEFQGNVNLPDPPSGEIVEVLENLQTLSCLRNFRCTEEVLKRIPNLKKLEISYTEVNLLGCKLPWEDMKAIDSLPNLEVLKLKGDAFIGEEWETTEGGFIRLKFLLLEKIDLEYWIVDSIHFPILERLVIKDCHDLEEIPNGIGEILTLELIELHYCSSSIVTSVEKILEEQRENTGDEVLQDIWENQTDERSTEEKPSTECTRADKADVKGQSDDTGSQIVEKEELSRGKEVIANEVEEAKRKKLTDLEAAIIIQSAYCGFAIRRKEPLKKLKQIAKVREQIAVIKLLIQEMESSSDIRRDNKEIHMIEEELTEFLCT